MTSRSTKWDERFAKHIAERMLKTDDGRILYIGSTDNGYWKYTIRETSDGLEFSKYTGPFMYKVLYIRSERVKAALVTATLEYLI